VAIGVETCTDITDYMVFCAAKSDAHAESLVEKIRMDLAETAISGFWWCYCPRYA
jgi:ribosomal silencing factor RsfS